MRLLASENAHSYCSKLHYFGLRNKFLVHLFRCINHGLLSTKISIASLQQLIYNPETGSFVPEEAPMKGVKETSNMS